MTTLYRISCLSFLLSPVVSQAMDPLLKQAQYSLEQAAHKADVTLITALLDKYQNLKGALCGNALCETIRFIWPPKIHERVAIIHLLTDRGADLTMPFDEMGTCALYYGIQDPTLCETLISRGAKIDQCDSGSKRSPLISAVISQRDKSVAILLAHGASVTCADKEGKTPLHYAIIMYPATPIENCDEQRMLHAAHLTIIQALIKKEASLDAQDNDGKTPLMYAAQHLAETTCPALTTYYEQGIALLLASGANYKLRDRKGQTALMHACSSDNPAARRTLLAKISATEQCDPRCIVCWRTPKEFHPCNDHITACCRHLICETCAAIICPKAFMVKDDTPEAKACPMCQTHPLRVIPIPEDLREIYAREKLAQADAAKDVE